MKTTRRGFWYTVAAMFGIGVVKPEDDVLQLHLCCRTDKFEDAMARVSAKLDHGEPIDWPEEGVGPPSPPLFGNRHYTVEELHHIAGMYNAVKLESTYGIVLETAEWRQFFRDTTAGYLAADSYVAHL